MTGLRVIHTRAGRVVLDQVGKLTLQPSLEELKVNNLCKALVLKLGVRESKHF